MIKARHLCPGSLRRGISSFLLLSVSSSTPAEHIAALGEGFVSHNDSNTPHSPVQGSAVGPTTPTSAECNVPLASFFLGQASLPFSVKAFTVLGII